MRVSKPTSHIRAAAYLEGALERHQRFMDDWLNRFTQALENTSLKEKAGPTEAGSGEPTRFPSIHLRRLRASEKEAREELRRSRESEDMLRKALEQIRKMQTGLYRAATSVDEVRHG